jgi:tetratricopeptide (TPR) repeat protein
LFVAAGDNGHALDQFQRALRLAPDDAAALAGAGQAAFEAGDYQAARKYLGAAPEAISSVRETREVVELVVSNDPLAARIGSTARRRRLAEAFSYAEQRLTACLEQRPGGQPSSSNELALKDEARAFEARLKPSSSLEEDTIESGVELIDRVERTVVHICPPASARDRALLLIGQHHGVNLR